MNPYIKTDPWRIVEEGFDPRRVEASESLFSIGNGAIGQRANFEERYSGKSLRESYIGGVYAPGRIHIGRWKNGYPEYAARTLNSACWIGIGVRAGGTEIDLAKNPVTGFYRELDMRRGVLTRRFTVELSCGRISVEAVRFVGMERTELGAVRYSVTPLDAPTEIELSPCIDADVMNDGANDNEKYWELVGNTPRSVTMRTLKTEFEVCWAAENRLEGSSFENLTSGGTVMERAVVKAAKGQTVTLYKYVGVCSSLNHAPEDLAGQAARVADEAAATGFEALLAEQERAWEEKWNTCDVVIDGDPEAQQGIRYCVFMMLQTYTGKDSRLNISPKGFTGGKYGGGTCWHTEAYCIPFYLATQGRQIARQLLLYRYHQLDKAIENARKLGFSGGAALYPMMTLNGEECHSEWEITFEEIHRNGSIAHAIFNYIRYTGDRGYLAPYGLEVLAGIARFWSQRVNFSSDKGKFVILGVTGPNEYENNVNNNWYTNYMARWCLEYAADSAEWVRATHPAEWELVVLKRDLDGDTEIERWRHIARNLYLPENEEFGIFLQQDGYMDKEQVLVRDLDPAHRPLIRKWSWDRILRSCFIRQADVLQGIYHFRDRFSREVVERNFRFYEERTVHESSLSSCVHAILASYLGDREKAYEMYLRTARLDIDGRDGGIDEGCHITSMAGSWLSVVEGFGGMRVTEDGLSFDPALPEGWDRLAFKVDFRGQTLAVEILRDGVRITCSDPSSAPEIMVGGIPYKTQ